MKVAHTILAASLLAVSFGAAAANPSTNLSVTGTIKPVSCTLTLGDGGLFDLGDIAKSSLSMTDDALLRTRDMSLTVDCGPAGAPVSLILTDNAASSSAWGYAGRGYYYGLGFGSDGTSKLGGYRMTATSMSMDGNPVLIGVAGIGPNPTTWEQHGTDSRFAPTSQIAATDADAHLIPTTQLAVDLHLSPYIQAMNKFPAGLLNTEQNLAGSSTLTVNYL
jgi:type 1 fimbria pilin